MFGARFVGFFLDVFSWLLVVGLFRVDGLALPCFLRPGSPSGPPLGFCSWCACSVPAEVARIDDSSLAVVFHGVVFLYFRDCLGVPR